MDKISRKRKHTGDVSAILTSDWHLRDTVPACREEVEFMEAQWNKVKFISDLQNRYDCVVLHAGDLFHHWKPSPYLISKTLTYLPKHFHTIYGNHDLPQHNLDLAEKCGIYTLQMAGALTVLNGVHWGKDVSNLSSITIRGRKILLHHTMIYQGKIPYPGCTDLPSHAYLRKHNFDLILTGHNHQTFVEELDGRLLVNPGGIMRQESDEADKVPKIFLYYDESNTVEVVELPHRKGVVSVPLQTKRIQEREERLNAFISKLNTNWEGSVDFDKNLQVYFSQNKVDVEVQGLVQKILEE